MKYKCPYGDGVYHTRKDLQKHMYHVHDKPMIDVPDEPSLKADMAAWIEQHSHGDLFARLDHLEADIANLPCGQCDEGERLEALEQQCKQCYLESKGEGP